MHTRHRPLDRPAITAAALAACLLAPSALRAQTAAGGVTVETYRFGTPEATGTESVTLLALPFAVSAPLMGPLRLQLSGAYARGSLDRSDGSSAELSGLTDTEVRLRLALAQERISVMALASLPTGSATQSAAEAEVAGLVSADLLPFRIAHWGTGGGAGLATAYHGTAGEMDVQFGVSYLVAFEFEPLEANRFGYRPGNQLSANIALQQRIGDSGRGAVQLLVQRYGNDDMDGGSLYAPGDRIQLVGSYSTSFGSGSSAIGYVGGMHRGSGSALHSLAQDGPSQTLLLAGGGLRLPVGGLSLLPAVDLRVLRVDDGVGQGYLAGAGIAAELPAGGLVIVPSMRARFGNVIVREGSESGITGLDLAVTARFDRARL